MDTEITQLENRVKVLMDWKKSRAKERLTNPVDYISRKALDGYKVPNPQGGVVGYILPTGKILSSNYLSLATAYTTFATEVSINGKIKTLVTMFELFPFTANLITNIMTSTNGQHGLINGDVVTLTTTILLPGNLAKNVAYYVVNSTPTTFQLSLTLNGAPIDIVSPQLGIHYFAKLS